MELTNLTEIMLSIKFPIPYHAQVLEFKETLPSQSPIQRKANMEQMFENFDYKRLYTPNSNLAKTIEYLKSKNEIDIRCSNGFIHVDKVQE